MVSALIACPRATFREKVGAVLIFGGTALAALFTVVTYPFSPSPDQPTLKKEVARVMFRHILKSMSVAQLQWAIPNSMKLYSDWLRNSASKADAPSQVVSEPIGKDEATLLWIGNRNAKRVILYLHSGGFVMSLCPGNIQLINYFRREVKRRSGVDVKCAFLDYTLSPGTKYPGQFRQAVLAVKHILDSGISPQDLVLSGDSAGGMLCMQIVSHILYPHPELPILPVPAVPFAGVLPMSAWLIFDSEAHSFHTNTTDILPRETSVAWGRLLREGTVLEGNRNEPGGFWAEPLKAPVEWWSGAEKVSQHFLFTYGEKELLKDDIVEFGKKFQAGVKGANVEVKVVGDPGGFHIDPALDFFWGRDVGEITKIMAGWVNDRLSSSTG